MDQYATKVQSAAPSINVNNSYDAAGILRASIAHRAAVRLQDMANDMDLKGTIVYVAHCTEICEQHKRMVRNLDAVLDYVTNES